MDAVKAKVAASVRNKVLQLHGLYLEDDLSIRPMETSIITDLVTQITVRTPSGSRFFSVRVSEHWA